MAYQVVLNDGRTYRARNVEHVAGFVIISLAWGGEIRVPMGQVVEVHTTQMQDGLSFATFLVLLFIVTFLTAFFW